MKDMLFLFSLIGLLTFFILSKEFLVGRSLTSYIFLLDTVLDSFYVSMLGMLQIKLSHERLSR